MSANWHEPDAELLGNAPQRLGVGQNRPVQKTTETVARGVARRGRPGYDQSSMLEVIVQVFNDHGYDAATLELIAKRLGLSKSAVYHHFSSKQEMLELALEQALGALEAVFDRVEKQGGSADVQIHQILHDAVIVACERRSTLTLLLRLHGNSAVERRAMERRRVLTARLRELFFASRDEGTLRDDLDPWLAARFSFGLVNSLVEWYRPDGSISPEDLAQSVIHYVRTGLRMSETGDFR